MGNRFHLVRLAAGSDPGVSHVSDFAALREANGYPELTPALRAKVFGYNAAVPYKISPAEVKLRRGTDKITRARTAYQEVRDPNYLTYGPKTRRDFLNLLRNGPV